MSTDLAHRYSDVSQACPIVFVHGSLSSRRIWTPYSAEFGTRQTIAVDLPGYGDEPAWPESALYRLTDAAATIRSAIEARREQTDLVAHSFGAAVALRYALNNPARVRTLTLVEPTWFGILRDLGPKARRREEKSFVWRGLSPRLVPIRTACSRARLTMCTAEGWAIAVGCRGAGCRAAAPSRQGNSRDGNRCRGALAAAVVFAAGGPI